ncbi:MAG TPA: thiol-activated cytolysin family protein [Kofleriaceae bacterium]|nr:thiol-activated cytolysin family protein [Kofleriaceae bacterium]
MKLSSATALASLLSLTAAACGVEVGGPAVYEEDPAVDDAALIDEYVRSLPYLPANPPSVVEGPTSNPNNTGDYQCVTENLQETRQYDKIVAYAANSDGLWPGAMVAGDSVYSGLFTQIVLPRKPSTISVSLENLAGARSATIAAPSLSSFREALGGILDAEITGATPANIYSEIEQVHSEEQLALALGAEVSWLGGSASIAASFNFAQQDTRSRYLVKFTQAYYTVDLDAPGRPSDLLSPDLDVEDVAPVMNENSPPLYVSSVTYGRMVVFTFESEYSAEELGSALEFAYSGGVDVSGQVSVTYKEMLSKSKITAFILGGSGGVAAQTIDSYDALIEFIKTGGDYSRQSPGAPIAYKLNYLKDNSPGRMSFTTDYTVTECNRVSQKLKVVLKSIRVEDAGGDAGDDLELYGNISAQAGNALSLFERGEDQHVVIRQGEAWPSGTFISEGIVTVRPQAGSGVQLGASLRDQDGFLNPNDNIGDVGVNVPFELGWRRDVSLLLTGDSARVTITIGLQPI